MRSPLVAAAAALALLVGAGSVAAQEYRDPKSDVAFATEQDGMALLGTGLRIKKIAFFKFKAYAFGFYIDEAAVEGPLAPFKGKPVSDEMRKVLQTADVKKELVLHFLRDLDAKKIQNAMREALEKGTDPKVLDQFISYFPEIKKGQRCTLRWVPGGTIETVMVGESKPAITDRAFAEKLFGLYVGPDPLQKDFKESVVARASEVLK
jgi:hypothetical protein